MPNHAASRSLCACALLALCALVRADAPAPLTVLVLGDSISANYGMRPDQGWVALASRQRDLQGLHWVNASVSGETSGGGLRRLPDLLQRHQPDIVVIELGGNDGLRGYPTAKIRDNLSGIVVAAQAQGAVALLLGMRIPPNYGPRYTRDFEATYRKAAATGNIDLVPFFLQDVATNPELMQADGIHPNAEAQPRLLANALEALRAAIALAGAP